MLQQVSKSPQQIFLLPLVQQFVSDLRNPNFFGIGECLIAAAEHYCIQIALHQSHYTPMTPVLPKSQIFHDVVHILFDPERIQKRY